MVNSTAVNTTPTTPSKSPAARMTRSKARDKSERPAAGELEPAVPGGQEMTTSGSGEKNIPVEGTEVTSSDKSVPFIEHPSTPPPRPMPMPTTPVTPRLTVTPRTPRSLNNEPYEGVTRRELNLAFGITPCVADPKANVDRCLQELRETISSDVSFVAKSNGRSVWVWVVETRILRVVTREAMAKAERAHTAYTLANEPSVPMPDPAVSAELSVIVRVHTDHCFLQPDAFWNPSQTHAGRFEDIKLQFAGTAPLRPALLRDDFDAAYNNLEWLMGQIEQPTTNRQGLLANENGMRRIHFRHVVFEPLTEENMYTEEELKLPAQYRTEAWPVDSTAARTALNSIKDTHRTRALQAYDMHGALIPPSEYMKMLRGAVCLVRFNVVSYLFGKVPKHRHTFVADVTYMRVLVPPTAPSVPVSPL